jgi:hypothetical protein
MGKHGQMINRWRQFRRLGVLIVVLVAVSVASFEPARSTLAQSGPAYELFYSEQTHYFFFWDPEKWTLEDQASEQGEDWVRLANGEIMAQYSALIAPGVDYVDCLHAMIDQLENEPSVLAVEALSAEGAPPEIVMISPPALEEAFTKLVVTLANGSDRDKYAVRLGCGPIESGQSVINTSIFVPARIYNEQHGLPLIFLPAVATSQGFMQQAQNRGVVSIPADALSGEGTLSASAVCPKSTVVGLASGAGQSDFVVDPASFSAIGSSGTDIPVSLVWSLPAQPANSTASIRPGDAALFQVLLDDSVTDRGFTLYYTSSSGKEIPIAQGERGCGGAGGGAPVLIDID